MEQCFSNFEVIATHLEDLLTTFFLQLQAMLLNHLYRGNLFNIVRLYVALPQTFIVSLR